MTNNLIEDLTSLIEKQGQKPLAIHIAADVMELGTQLRVKNLLHLILI